MVPNPYKVTKAELKRVAKLMKYLQENKIDVDDDPWFAEKDLLLYAYQEWPRMWTVKREEEVKVALLATHLRKKQDADAKRANSYVA